MEIGEINDEIQKVIKKNKSIIIYYKNNIVLEGPFEILVVKNIYFIKNKIFYETEKGKISKIIKNKKSEIIGSGRIMGIVNETIVWNKDKEFFIHKHNITNKISFIYINNILKYVELPYDKIIKNQVFSNILYFCLYKEYLVLAENNILFFISLKDKNIVQYKNELKIYSIQPLVINSIELLQINGWNCYFYYNNKIIIDKITILNFRFSIIQFFKELELKEQILFLNNNKISTIILEQIFCRVIGKAKTISEFIKKSKEKEKEKENESKKFFENNNQIIYKANEKINTKIRRDIKNLVEERLTVFNETQINNVNLLKKNYTEKTTVELFIEDSILAINRLKNFDFFYENIFPIQEFLRKAIINEISHQFQVNKYKRIFFYDKKILLSSKNLAYRTIAAIKKYSKKKRTKKLTKDLFFSALRTIFKDTRANDIFEILTENSLILDKSTFDFEDIRIDCFKYRVFACAGSLLFPNEKWGFEYSLKLNCNRSDFLKDIDKNFLFFFSAANFNGTIEITSENQKFQVLASNFGKNIIESITNSQISDLILMLNLGNTKDNTAHYILLTLASVSPRMIPGQIVSDMDTNRAFLTYLKKKDMHAKTIAIICLAIYNFNSQNRNIFTTLLKECSLTGPMIHEERYIDYYTPEYRVLAAISAAMIYSVKSPIFLEDKFAELFINGLSFIDTGIYSNYMIRGPYNRPVEVFYGKLFTLLNSFELTINDAIDFITNSLFSNKSIDLYQITILAAYIFYIAFKIFKNPKIKVDNLHNWFYKVIDHSERMMLKNYEYKVLFNFSLISFSLIRNSTFDLRLLTIIRRQILATTDPYEIYSGEKFSMDNKSMLTYYGPGFESIHYYKICMAIVCAGLGTMKLKLTNLIDYKVIIVTFLYFDSPLFLFKQSDFFKFLLPKVFEKNINFIKKLKKALRKNKQKEIRKKLTHKFWNKFNKKSILDKKYIIDVLSDFIENYSTNLNRNLFDLYSFAKIITVIK